jgi:hypothetical protein
VTAIRTARANNRQVARIVITRPPVAVMKLPITLSHTDRLTAVGTAAITPAIELLSELAKAPRPYTKGALDLFVGVDVLGVRDAGEHELTAALTLLLDRRPSDCF